LRKNVCPHEEEDNEQSTDRAVAIKEGVNRLELVVEKRAPDENGHQGLLVCELLPIRKGILHGINCWRYENGGLRTIVGRADPVLRCSELARVPLLASNTL